MAERLYSIRGKSLTSAQVAELPDVTREEMHAFSKQAGMSDRDLQLIQAITGAFAPVIREFVVKSLANLLPPLKRQIEELEARLGAQESKPLVPWAGPWEADKQFTRNTFCSDRGGMWFAMADSKGVRPGSADGVWKLCVKAGRDGKDATR